MYKNGHIGLALVCAAPVAIVVAALTDAFWGITVLGASFTTARVPDIDQQLPGITHRGFTHTVWFGLIVSIGLASMAALGVSFRSGVSPAEDGIVAAILTSWVLGIVLATGFFIGICSHLIGDMLTVSRRFAVQPFWPISSKQYRFGLTTADSKVWNWGLLCSGIVAAAISVVIIAQVL